MGDGDGADDDGADGGGGVDPAAGAGGDRDRFGAGFEATADDPAVHPDDARVCVVATVDYTFERCAEGFYPCPRSYPRTERAFEHLAFYRTAPTSAVTHYARVTDRFEDDGEWMGPGRFGRLIGRFSDADVATVFELDGLVELADPVAGDGQGVRGAWYCTLGDLRAARTVPELADRAGTGG